MITKEPARQEGWVRVTFELPSSMWAGLVHLMGGFKDWDTSATPISQSHATGDWRVTLELEGDRRCVIAIWWRGRSGSTIGTPTIASKTHTAPEALCWS